MAEMPMATEAAFIDEEWRRGSGLTEVRAIFAIEATGTRVAEIALSDEV
jgi:hypothetical protein